MSQFTARIFLVLERHKALKFPRSLLNTQPEQSSLLYIARRWSQSQLTSIKSITVLADSVDYSLAQFILETNYPSGRIIRLTDNSSTCKSEDEFWQIMRLDINC